MKKYQRVIVRWIDSCGPYHNRWTTPDALNLKPMICETTGYLIRDKKNYVVIVGSVSNTGMMVDFITIPKAAILKRWDAT